MDHSDSDHLAAVFDTLHPVLSLEEPENHPPLPPNQPQGPAQGDAGIPYSYISNTTDPENDEILYLFDWGDNTNSSWLGPYSSGYVVNATHSWSEKGLYKIKVKAKDIHGLESSWSDSLDIEVS